MATVHLLHRTYDEALALLVTARDYLSYATPATRSDLEPAQRLRVSCEAMRVTARLSHVMVWLLAQKAVQTGEITAQAAAEAYQLYEDDVCLMEAEGEPPGLPEGLQDLLYRSRALYVRVTRLDQLVRQSASA